MIRVDKCPHCGIVLDVSRYAKYERIGNPLNKCPNCKKVYAEKSCFEYAVALFYQKVIALGALGLNVFISTFFTFVISFFLLKTSNIIICVGVWIAVDIIATVLSRLIRNKAIKASQIRCKANALYVLELGAWGLADIKSEIYREAVSAMEHTPDENISKLIKLGKLMYKKKMNKALIITAVATLVVVLVCALVTLNRMGVFTK